MLVLPATPQLWQPRNGQWWRRPRWRAPLEWFAGHLQYGSGTGHLKRNASSGHLSHTCGGGTGCFCDFTTIRVVLSVTRCACWAIGNGNYARLSADPSGTYDLTINGALGTCEYSNFSTGVTGDTHGDAACSSAFLTPPILAYATAPWPGSGGFILQFGWTSGNAGGHHSNVFYSTATLSNCDPFVMNNQLTTCDAHNALAINGTASVSFI